MSPRTDVSSCDTLSEDEDRNHNKVSGHGHGHGHGMVMVMVMVMVTAKILCYSRGQGQEMDKGPLKLLESKVSQMAFLSPYENRFRFYQLL